MLEKFEKYCESEYFGIKNYLERHEFSYTRKCELINHTTSMLLGACTFIQIIDPTINFDDLNIIYNSFRKALDELIK